MDCGRERESFICDPISAYKVLLSKTKMQTSFRPRRATSLDEEYKMELRESVSLHKTYRLVVKTRQHHQ